jgi:type VI secretion system protein ImpL
VFRNSDSDVALLDFARVFGPQGVIAAFFDQHLRPYVDTTTRPWRWKRVDNVDLGFSPAALVQFQRAGEIRDAFFATGSTPSTQFELTPTDLDAAATRAVLELGTQSLVYTHGSATPAQWQWPGPGPSVARLAIEPPSAGKPASLTRNGPWSFFRLLDAGEVEREGGTDLISVSFRLGGHTVRYSLRASSVVNPFTSDAVRQFRCPPSL